MQTINEFLFQFHLNVIIRAVLLAALGYFIARLLSASVGSSLRKRMKAHQIMLLRRVVFYIVFLLFLTSAVQQLGFQISALLGATGILTVAIGIASQTSMSNMVSGIFIIGEKPFELGDTIKVNEHQGEVIAINFLSVKIRTNDNMMVRIPNEVLIKSAIINVSYFPKRRCDLIIQAGYEDDIEKIRDILLSAAEHNTLGLKDPKPVVSVDEIGGPAVRLQFSAWATRENFKPFKSSLQEDIRNALAKQRIELNNPRTVPIKIISQSDSLV